MPVPTVENVSLADRDLEVTVKVAGDGPPAVYLHTAGGPVWDPFLDALAEHHTVYAPDHPGTGDSKRESIHNVDTLWDLILVYEELFDALGLDGVPLIGSSFGGMIGCELAAHNRGLVSKLVLLDPIGLWRDDAPVALYMLLSPDELMATLFSNMEADFVRQFLASTPTDPNELAVYIAESTWAMAATGKFVWPLPDKGLKKRIHRIRAPTLILWGADDKLIPAVYGSDFKSRIPGSRLEIITGSGHVPQWEQPAKVTPLVLDFIRDTQVREET